MRNFLRLIGSDDKRRNSSYAFISLESGSQIELEKFISRFIKSKFYKCKSLENRYRWLRTKSNSFEEWLYRSLKKVNFRMNYYQMVCMHKKCLFVFSFLNRSNEVVYRRGNIFTNWKIMHKECGTITDHHPN